MSVLDQRFCALLCAARDAKQSCFLAFPVLTKVILACEVFSEYKNPLHVNLTYEPDTALGERTVTMAYTARASNQSPHKQFGHMQFVDEASADC